MEADEQQQQRSVAEQVALSALQANIQEKRDNSYYYAHKKKNTGEDAAPLPEPIILERSVLEVPEQFVTIFSYQFLDEDDVVKVYIPLEGVGAACTDSSIECDFQVSSLTVCIRDYKPGQVQRLVVKKLWSSIDPVGCKFRRLANKVVVTLKKSVEEGGHASKWSKLAA